MDEDLNRLLRYIKDLRGVDFNSYRPGTLKRRLERRLDATNTSDYAEYLQYLNGHPEELDGLIDSLTIKVSCFFRNPLVFEAIRCFVLPQLIDACRGNILRVWSAGCARGEEAYSLAILLHDIFTKEQTDAPLFIIGTDIDRKALSDAKKGLYNAEAVSEVRKRCLDRYFINEEGRYRLTGEVRSMVTLAYHDVMNCTSPKEGVFSGYHLILCRNVLICYDRDLQKKVLKCLSELVLKDGCLVLGEAETLPEEVMKGFREIIPDTKIFRKRG